MIEKPLVWIHGISGRMGTTLEAEVRKHVTLTLQGGSDHRSTLSHLEEGLKNAKLVIDFSSAEGNHVLQKAIFNQAKHIQGCSLVICSTGLSEEQKKDWEKISKQCHSSVLFAPNTSLGILMMMKSALVVAGLSRHAGFDIEIEECHHKHKKDIPSGTTLYLAETLSGALPGSTIADARKGPRKDNEIGMIASRGGGVFGEHKIRFLGEFEEFTLSHRAFSRELFAKGAIVLGEWLLKQTPSVYTLNDIKLDSMFK